MVNPLQVNLLHYRMELCTASNLRQRYQFNRTCRVSSYNSLHPRYHGILQFLSFVFDQIIFPRETLSLGKAIGLFTQLNIIKFCWRSRT